MNAIMYLRAHSRYINFKTFDKLIQPKLQTIETASTCRVILLSPAELKHLYALLQPLQIPKGSALTWLQDNQHLLNIDAIAVTIKSTSETLNRIIKGESLMSYEQHLALRTIIGQMIFNFKQ